MESTAQKTSSKKKQVKKSANKAKKIKVVEVKLSSKAKKAKAPKNKVSPKKVVSKKVTPRKVASKKAAANKSTKITAKKITKKVSSRKAPKRKTVSEKRVEEKKVSAKLERVKIPSPTKKQLKPFLEAAKQTRKIRKEIENKKKRKKSFLAKPSRKGKKYTLDLRIHSPASNTFQSPASIDPVSAIISLAKVKGLDVIGITDHIAVSHIDRIKLAAEDSKVTVIPGLDLRCRVGDSNWVSIIALFPESHGQLELTQVLEGLEVPLSSYGSEEFCIKKPFAEVIELIESFQGVVIPSQVDKTPNQKCAIPKLINELGFHAFDLVHPEKNDFFNESWPEGEFTFFSFSNASALGQIGSRRSLTKLCKPGFEGIKELVARR